MPPLVAALLRIDDDNVTDTQPVGPPTTDDAAPTAPPTESEAPVDAERDGEAAVGSTSDNAHGLDTQSQAWVAELRADVSAAQHRSRLALADMLHHQNRRLFDNF